MESPPPAVFHDKYERTQEGNLLAAPVRVKIQSCPFLTRLHISMSETLWKQFYMDDGLCLWVLSKRWHWINDKLYIYFYVNIWYRTIIDSWWLMVDMIWRRDLLDVPEQLDEGAAEGPLAHLTGNLKKKCCQILPEKLCLLVQLHCQGTYHAMRYALSLDRRF